VVRPAGIEPTTFSFGGCTTAILSYCTTVIYYMYALELVRKLAPDILFGLFGELLGDGVHPFSDQHL